MESQCSIGVIINEACHKSVYGVFPKDITLIEDYCEEEKVLLFLRVGPEVKSTCKYHEMKYLKKFHHLFGQSCLDPFKKHKKPITKGLREITFDHYSKNKSPFVNIIPGKSLCPTCYSKIFVIDKEKDSDTSDKEFCDLSETIKKVDSACEILGISPARKIRKLSEEKRPIALNTKIEKVAATVKKNLEVSFQQKICTKTDGCSKTSPTEYDDLIEKLKTKCRTSNKEDKIKIISLLPNSWSRAKVSDEFNVSERLVKLTRQLVKEQGILPVLQKKSASNLIDENTIKNVIRFYEDDNNSRLMPGKKDCVSVKENGSKVQKQKRLILCNLNELFTEFKKENPDIKIGRSKFCELRPRWCIVAGASGTHNVCVCLYHQNVKLMTDGANLRVDYKDLLEVMVCNIDSYNCMIMGKCEDCPGKQALLDMFEESEEDDLMPDNIEYKQWVTQDRTEMVTVIKPREEFFEVLVAKLENLKMHHFIAKAQSKFMKDKKQTLAVDECLILADFSENYSFVVQDEVQGHHWVNKQATVHPFVFYYKDEDKLKSHSFCVISDYLEHNTTAVHTFQLKLTNYIKQYHPSIKKLIYFSDGAASQYKNKKNFINISFHKEDFGFDVEWHFFASCHGKNACDGVGGTTKRAVTKASLQRTDDNHIITPQEMFKFCKEHIKGITYVFVKCEEIQEVYANVLKERFNTCQKIKGTRSFHCFVPHSHDLLKCKITSTSPDSELHQCGKRVQLALQNKDIVACVYDEQWWIAEVDNIDCRNQDLHVFFYHPPGPRTSFKKVEKDQVWMPLTNVLRKLSPMEFTTVTGRTFNLTPKLSEEISQMFNERCTKNK